MMRNTVGKIVVGLCLAGTLGCNPATSNSSASAVAEPVGANCAAGGVAIRSGVDTDNDGVISAGEAKSTQYICNGVAATPGDAGTPAVITLNKVVAEAAGSNCTDGGYAFQTGLDDNGNGQLDAAEVDSTQYLCNSSSSGSTAPVRLSKAYLGGVDAVCPGGYVRIGFGNDTDGNGTLSTTEQTGSIVICNSLPKVTSAAAFVIADCNATPIVVPLTSVDVDGQVVSTSIELVSSGSPLVLSSGADGSIHLEPGAHVSGAVIGVTLTDDVGATSVTELHLIFSGTGCVPLISFYGVDPTTCISIEVEPLADGDRGGAVVTANYVFYNGDDGLVRTALDLTGLVQIIDARVDGLIGDPQRGTLLSLWSSEWDATLADGGTGPGITGLTDPNAAGRFEAFASPEPLDQIAVLDETTLAPTTRFALPQPIGGSVGLTFELAGDAGADTFAQQDMIVAAAEGQALIARTGDDVNGYHGVLYQLIDTTTGAVTLSRELIFENTDPAFSDYVWQTQEVEIQHYAMHKRGAEYVLTYRSGRGWMELELAAGQPVLLTQSFVSTCDAHDISFSADFSQVYFHSEYDCFGSNTEEALIRCNVLTSSNLDGGVDDDGNGSEGGGGPAIGKRK
jgi:hypothetical protein